KLLDDAKSAAKDVRLATIAALARDLRDAGKTLGILVRPPSEFLLSRRARLCIRRKIDPAQIEASIAERITARAAKDFTRADQIRDAVKAQGVDLMDTPAGTTWRIV